MKKKGLHFVVLVVILIGAIALYKNYTHRKNTIDYVEDTMSSNLRQIEYMIESALDGYEGNVVHGVVYCGIVQNSLSIYGKLVEKTGFCWQLEQLIRKTNRVLMEIEQGLVTVEEARSELTEILDQLSYLGLEDMTDPSKDWDFRKRVEQFNKGLSGQL